MARAEVLLQEGEAAEDMSVIADAVSGFNAALKLASRAQCRWTGRRRRAG